MCDEEFAQEATFLGVEWAVNALWAGGFETAGHVDSSTRPWPSGGPDDGDVRSNAVQPDELVHPFTLDGCLTLQFQAEFYEERDSSHEVPDHNAA